jgi:hypothetical protein
VKLQFVTLARAPSTLAQYVNFWANQYKDPRPHLYKDHVGQPRTREAILALFEWKNGQKLSAKKRRSVMEHYVMKSPQMPNAEDREAHVAFVSRGGGAIWRIFWLHCNRPKNYPIFDQHVYRSMTFLRDGTAKNLSGNDRAKAEIYWDDYLPFRRSLKYSNYKRLDEALWVHGKFLSRYSI